MPPPKMHGDGRKAKNPRKTLVRLLGYMKKYWLHLTLVLLSILLSALANTKGSENVGTLVDDYILPLVGVENPDYGPLVGYILQLGLIFGLGILGSFLNQYLMVPVSQGTQRVIRDQMFAKMQKLPLRYFDSNTAGNIMSRYTGDIDTLRQMISMSIPQAISAIATLVVLLITMLIKSWILTVVSMITIFCVIFATKFLAGKSAKFFIGQQKSLGALNGYIEEMISGQKVIKVFNHEEAAKADFDRRNEELCANAYAAGKFSNMMGPINNNLGYVQ